MQVHRQGSTAALGARMTAGAPSSQPSLKRGKGVDPRAARVARIMFAAALVQRKTRLSSRVPVGQTVKCIGPAASPALQDCILARSPAHAFSSAATEHVSQVKQ